MGGGGAPAANNGGRPAQGRFGLVNGTNGLREGRLRWRARLFGLGRKESKQSGEGLVGAANGDELHSCSGSA